MGDNLGSAYLTHFEGTKFPYRMGVPGTTARLDNWIMTLASCLNNAVISPRLAQVTFTFIDMPDASQAVISYRYLPLRVDGKRPLISEENGDYRVDSISTFGNHLGVAYRRSKQFADRDRSRAGPRHGELVSCIEEMDGWIKVAIRVIRETRYLPMQVLGISYLMNFVYVRWWPVEYSDIFALDQM